MDRPRHVDPAALERADAWAPELGSGHWRNLYAECCDAVLAYDRVVATMPAGPLRTSLADRRGELVDRLAHVWRLAETATVLYPAGPFRDDRLLALLADDAVEDLRGRLADPPPDPGLRAALLGLRAELWTVTEEAARVVLRLRENRNATDLGTWLRALAAGVAAARRAGWTPTGYTVDGDG